MNEVVTGKSTRSWIKPLGGLLTLVGILAVVTFGQLAGGTARTALEAATTSVEDYEKAVDNLSSDPLAGAVWSELQARFPVEYASIRRELATSLKAGASREEIQRQSFAAVRNFILTQVGNVAVAPDSELVRLARANLAMTLALQADNVDTCAEFAQRGLSDNSQLSPATQKAAAVVTQAMIGAAAAGRAEPVKRPAQVRTSEANAFFDAIERLAPNSRIVSLIAEPETVANPTAQEHCSTSVTIYQALTALPDPVAAIVMASMVKESAALAAS